MTINMSYSRLDCFMSCRKRYHWSYVERLTPKAKAQALQIGDITHRLLEQADLGKLTSEHIHRLPEIVQGLYDENTAEVSYDVALSAGHLVAGYLDFWQGDEAVKVISPEMSIEHYIPELDVLLYGRLDALGQTQDKSLWRLERKTTSRYNQSFLKGQKSGLQTAIAHYILESINIPIRGTIFDLLIKTNKAGNVSFHRASVPIDRAAITRMIRSLTKAVEVIRKGDFNWPNLSRCFGYNKDCSYKILCDMEDRGDSTARITQAMEDFYIRREERIQVKDTRIDLPTEA